MFHFFALKRSHSLAMARVPIPPLHLGILPPSSLGILPPPTCNHGSVRYGNRASLLVPRPTTDEIKAAKYWCEIDCKGVDVLPRDWVEPYCVQLVVGLPTTPHSHHIKWGVTDTSTNRKRATFSVIMSGSTKCWSFV